MSARHVATMLAFQQDQLDAAAADVDLESMGALSGEDARNVARWLEESHETFCRKVAESMKAWWETHHGRPCPWTRRAIQEALRRRMEATS